MKLPLNTTMEGRKIVNGRKGGKEQMEEREEQAKWRKGRKSGQMKLKERANCGKEGRM